MTGVPLDANGNFIGTQISVQVKKASGGLAGISYTCGLNAYDPNKKGVSDVFNGTGSVSGSGNFPQDSRAPFRAPGCSCLVLRDVLRLIGHHAARASGFLANMLLRRCGETLEVALLLPELDRRPVIGA
jgi:hypothetical protein